MAQNNLCKFIQKSEIQTEWWGYLVVQKQATVREAIDGSGECWVSLPRSIRSVDDVPEEWKELYQQNEPYQQANDQAVLDIIRGPKYQADPDA